MTNPNSPTSSIEVSPEMIEAGARAIHAVSAEPEHGDIYDTLSLGWKDNLRQHAFECYLAMKAAEPLQQGDVRELLIEARPYVEQAGFRHHDVSELLAKIDAALVRSKLPIVPLAKDKERHG